MAKFEQTILSELEERHDITVVYKAVPCEKTGSTFDAKTPHDIYLYVKKKS
jgi:hypothetical protein